MLSKLVTMQDLLVQYCALQDSYTCGYTTVCFLTVRATLLSEQSTVSRLKKTKVSGNGIIFDIIHYVAPVTLLSIANQLHALQPKTIVVAEQKLSK